MPARPVRSQKTVGRIAGYGYEPEIYREQSAASQKLICRLQSFRHPTFRSSFNFGCAAVADIGFPKMLAPDPTFILGSDRQQCGVNFEDRCTRQRPVAVILEQPLSGKRISRATSTRNAIGAVTSAAK